jgi:dTDP-4-amino-4,6-dideoxygalactose transaminase
MIPFNKPYLTGREFAYIQEAVQAAQLAGNGRFTRQCQQWLQDRLGAPRVLLTQSCTAALEMAALLADLKADDEVIMPSFTFVSTANAFVLRGARPVFVDIRPDTLNIDERRIEAAITSRTRAIVVVHYAGIACNMEPILDIARRHDLLVIEDAAQALGSMWHGRPLGTFGHMVTLSFHETKNVISGEGGALILNDARLVERAEVLWEKGTNRTRFFRGEISKYTWIDLGSSYLPSEMTAAFLLAQLEHADEITAGRLAIWRAYEERCAAMPFVRPPVVPEGCTPNAHLFYLLLPTEVDRAEVLKTLNARGVNAVFHYVPLHSAPAGLRFGRPHGSMSVTDDCSSRLIRLPLWMGMTREMTACVVDAVQEVLAAQPR